MGHTLHFPSWDGDGIMGYAVGSFNDSVIQSKMTSFSHGNICGLGWVGGTMADNCITACFMN